MIFLSLTWKITLRKLRKTLWGEGWMPQTVRLEFIYLFIYYFATHNELQAE